MTTPDPKGFLSRWSQRKLDAKSGLPVDEPVISTGRVRMPLPLTGELVPVPVPARNAASPVAGATDPSAHSTVDPITLPGSSGPAQAQDLPKLPTLADVQGLSPQSDFKPFLARGVANDVKNAALKKLFADPHYNVMDRLDTYIDDYSLADPIPEAMLRQMASAKFLRLFDDEPADPAKPLQSDVLRDDANTAGRQVVAQSAPSTSPVIAPCQAHLPESETLSRHDHIDMRLQPNHAPGREGAGNGTA